MTMQSVLACRGSRSTPCKTTFRTARRLACSTCAPGLACTILTPARLCKPVRCQTLFGQDFAAYAPGLMAAVLLCECLSPRNIQGVASLLVEAGRQD